MPVQILVIDDDELSREVLALLLQNEGYAVETADSGDAALLHVTTAHLPDVVLTDLQMQEGRVSRVNRLHRVPRAVQQQGKHLPA